MSRFIKTKVWTIIFLLLNVLLSYLLPALRCNASTHRHTYICYFCTPFPAEGPLPYGLATLTEDGFC